MLFPVTFVLSNLVSNVPAVMLLLPVATHPLAGPMLALVEHARRQPAHRRQHREHHRGGRGAAPRRPDRLAAHARIGVPVTLATLAIAAAWLAGASRVANSRSARGVNRLAPARCKIGKRTQALS